YGATQVGWWVVLRPIRDRTKELSLRSAAQIDSGERVYDPSAPLPAAPPLARSEPMTSSFVDPPPPPPSAPPPPVPGPVMRAAKPESPRPAPRAPVREPETADSLVRKAGALVATGTYEAALDGFEEALRLDSTNVPALQGKAACHERLNQRSEALETCLNRERERKLPAGPRPLRRDPRDRPEQRERPDRQGRCVSSERQAARGPQLPRPRARRATGTCVRPPEPRENPPRTRQCGSGARTLRSTQAPL